MTSHFDFASIISHRCISHSEMQPTSSRWKYERCSGERWKRALCSFETSGYIKLPSTQRDIPEDQNPQHQYYGSLKSPIHLVFRPHTGFWHSCSNFCAFTCSKSKRQRKYQLKCYITMTISLLWMSWWQNQMGCFTYWMRLARPAILLTSYLVGSRKIVYQCLKFSSCPSYL